MRGLRSPGVFVRDRLGNPVHRGDRLVDDNKNVWVVLSPAADQNAAHIQHLKSGRKVRADVGAFVLLRAAEREKLPPLPTPPSDLPVSPS